MALEAVLFDLDGTLLDTAPDMIGTLNSLRLDDGLAALPFEQLRAEVSHGSSRLVQIGFPGVDAERFAPSRWNQNAGSVALQHKTVRAFLNHLTRQMQHRARGESRTGFAERLDGATFLTTHHAIYRDGTAPPWSVRWSRR